LWQIEPALPNGLMRRMLLDCCVPCGKELLVRMIPWLEVGGEVPGYGHSGRTVLSLTAVESRSEPVVGQSRIGF
jgi:hypothetical protein